MITKSIELNEGLTRAGDIVYAFRFLKLLVTPFNKTKAFELGIIDEKGKVLKKAAERKTPEEKDAYTMFHRLVFNIKKLIPGKRLGSYAAALFLIRESTGMSDEAIMKCINETGEPEFIDESFSYISEGSLVPGNFFLKKNACNPVTGDELGNIGDCVVNEDFQDPIGNFMDINIYRVKHKITNQELYVTQDILER